MIASIFSSVVWASIVVIPSALLGLALLLFSVWGGAAESLHLAFGCGLVGGIIGSIAISTLFTRGEASA